MTSALAAIHVARKQLGLEEDDYRALLRRVTGKDSAGAMSHEERGRVLAELRRIGFKHASKPAGTGARALDGPYAGKLRALWISGWNLGAVQNRTDQALLAFVERQTGISHTRFLRDAGDAKKAIEALKDWLAREANVDWSVDRRRPDLLNEPKFQVVMAQWRKLIALDAIHIVGDQNLTMTARLALETGKASFDELTGEDWSTLMRALGRSIRAALRGKERKAA
jgi:phage gp16-like protein